MSDEHAAGESPADFSDSQNVSDDGSLAAGLNLDRDEARALHRIVRAMHDGECPKCHAIHSSNEMRCSDGGWRCPGCRFFILKSEADAVLATFGEFMERNLAIFEKWRAERKEQPHAD